MTDDHDDLDERIASTSAELLKTLLTIARSRAEDQETRNVINNLSAVRLVVTAVRADIQLELVATINGETLRIYAATFKEQGALH